MVEFVEQVSDRKHNQLDEKHKFIFAGAILIAILYDFLFYDKMPGVSYPIFIFFIYTVLYKVMKKSLPPIGCFESFLILPVLTLSLTYMFFSNQVLRMINSILIPALLMAQILLITEKNKYDWFRIEFLKDILRGILVWPFIYIPNFFYVIPKLTSEDNELTKKSIVKKVMIGIIFSLPVLVIVITLLTSADLVFGNMVKQIFSNISFVDIILHTLMITFITILTFSFFWGLTYSNRTQVPYKNSNPKLDVISVLTGLCLLNMVYGVFSYIQFTYLFSSIFNLLPEGFTHAEYARRGFFELVVVAIVNVAIVLGSLNLTKVAGVRSVKAFKVLNCGLVVSTLVMLVSSFFKMYLYEEAYGYTYLRVFTHEFMLMLFFILGVTLYKVWWGKLNLAKWYIMISLISYVLVNYVNVDVFIAQKNMERYYKTGIIDVVYLSEMSYDTTSYLKELSNSPNVLLSAEVQKAIGARKKALVVEGKWQSYNLSQQRAASLLNE